MSKTQSQSRLSKTQNQGRVSPAGFMPPAALAMGTGTGKVLYGSPKNMFSPLGLQQQLQGQSNATATRAIQCTSAVQNGGNSPIGNDNNSGQSSPTVSPTVSPRGTPKARPKRVDRGQNLAATARVAGAVSETMPTVSLARSNSIHRPVPRVLSVQSAMRQHHRADGNGISSGLISKHATTSGRQGSHSGLVTRPRRATAHRGTSHNNNHGAITNTAPLTPTSPHAPVDAPPTTASIPTRNPTVPAINQPMDVVAKLTRHPSFKTQVPQPMATASTKPIAQHQSMGRPHRNSPKHPRSPRTPQKAIGREESRRIVDREESKKTLADKLHRKTAGREKSKKSLAAKEEDGCLQGLI